MTTQPYILSVPRNDGDNDNKFVILHVASSGNSPLDLTLVGTEGTNPYNGSISLRDIGKLRAKNYQGDAGEWEGILSFALTKRCVLGQSLENFKGIEFVASVHDGKSITLTLRRNIGGITQRLGSISLQYDGEQEIQLFEWTHLSATANEVAQTDVTKLKSTTSTQLEEIESLKAQLAELISAKEGHENTLLEKFSKLLNSKKSKIRDLQRVLESLSADQGKEGELSEASGSIQGHKPLSSRSKKRKAPPKSNKDSKQPDITLEEEDPMDIVENFEEGSLDEREETPNRSESEATESDDGAERQHPQRISRTASKPTRSGPTATKTQKGGRRRWQRKKAEGNGKDGNVEEPPPRRELPFEDKISKSKLPQARSMAENDTSEDDDEL